MAPGGFGDVPAEHSPPLGRGMRMGKPADIPLSQKPARQADCRCQLGCFGNEVGKMSVFTVRQWPAGSTAGVPRSEEHTSELQSLRHLVCRLLLEKKKKKKITNN